MENQQKITPRLNVSLIGNDGETLERLRTALETRLSKRLALAEVVRIAIHNQAIHEGVEDADTNI